MADLDHLFDFKGKIGNYIAEQIAELFHMTPNEFNYPAWLQATLLFHEVVVPCDYDPTDELIELAKKLVLTCVDHNNKAYFYQEDNGKKVNRMVVRVDKEACAINRWICQALEINTNRS